MLCGPSGTGKTLVAKAIHAELANLNLIETNGEMLSNSAELISILLSATSDTTIFIDEVTINFVIDGGGSAITTGIKGDIELGMALTIDEVRLLCDQSATIAVDIWKDTYANFPPTNDDSITDAGTTPATSAAAKYTDATLTSWTTSIAAEEILRINVDANDNAERCTLTLECIRA